MATTTHSVPSFDIAAADDMDLHSDNDGLEYNDGDIELDLEPPSYGPDDDVSIDDAVSANGMEAQAVPSGDNDDYMVDQEDVIEEDYSYQDVDVDISTEQPVVTDTITTEAQVEVEVQDEDLLDYSEEDNDYQDPALRSPWLQQNDSMEDEPDQTQDTSAQQDEPVQTQDAPTEQGEAHEVQDTNTQQDETPADLQALMSMNTNKNSQSPQAHTDVVADDSLNAEHHENLPPSQPASPEGDAQANDDDGGVLLNPQEEHTSTESGHNDTSNPIHDHDESAQDSEHREDASFQLPPVTVNCMGEELWLFKQHDYEGSGDWLLEDASAARTSMSDLFQACRSALGPEVLNGMEIGFRFDHFQNMELFEDSTASVAVSLERLVGYYHMLYAQDGNNEPDSFYITLMYRPRFATLLADIARYADSGRGYSGFEAAIAAGETNFHSASLGLPVDQTTEWETEGQEPEQEYDQEQVDGDEHESEHEHERDASEQTHGENALEEKYEEDVNEKYEEDASEVKHVEDANEEKYEEDTNEEKNGEEDQVQQDAEVEARADHQLEPEQQEQTYEEAQTHENHEPEANYHEADYTQDAHEEGGVDVHEDGEVAAQDASVEADEEHNDEEQPLDSYEVSADVQEVADEPEQKRSQAEEQTAAELEARRLQQEGDIIDYSDGEDEDSAAVEEVEQAPHTQLSPSPATVQGDESTSAEQQLPVGVSPSNGKETNGDDDRASLDTSENPQSDEEIEEINGESAEYWEFLEATEERESTEESQLEEVGSQGDLEYTQGEEFYAGEDGTTDGHDLTGANDVLDLDHAQWAVEPELGQEAVEETATTYEDDHVDIQDEEDGVAGHVASATSSAADPTTASSTEAHEVSPQGHKRSIDEVGHGVDIAPDSIDAKRARV